MRKTIIPAVIAIWMVVMTAPVQANAQSSVFTTVFTGMSIDQSGPLAFPYAPIFGGSVTFGLAGDYLRLGVEHNGGNHFRPYDTAYHRPVNAPATQFIIGFGVPAGLSKKGKNSDGNAFAGSVIGIGYGPSFPSYRELGIGSTGKLFLQLNCGGKIDDKYWIGGTFRGGLNLLWIEHSRAIPSWGLEVGVVFGQPLGGGK